MERRQQPTPPPPMVTGCSSASSMSAQPLLDAFPSYISFYRHKSLTSSSSFSSPPTTNSDRTSIIKWFSSLSTHHRLSYLTIVDRDFTRLLFLMASKLRSHGPGTFFILPDVPSCHSPELPSLLFRKSRGFMARVAESNDSEQQFIRHSVRLFCSAEGERDSGGGCSCSCSCSASSVDAVTFSEGFVSDVDRFVEAMDWVSDSDFLGSDWGEFGSDWIELRWLKAKGYYSLEAFVANRVEVALRLAWLTCNGGKKKRGLKLKERAISSVGLASNAYWRKKGCVDWWEKLDNNTRRKALLMIMGKTTKSLVGEILKGAGGELGNKMWLFSGDTDLHTSPFCKTTSARGVSRQDAELGLRRTIVSCPKNSPSFGPDINGLYVLQDIIHLILAFQHNDFGKSQLFFSSLDTIDTIHDFIVRKLRGLLMVVSLDSTRIELLEEENVNFSTKKSKEKQGSTSRRKKGKSRCTKKLDSSKISEHDCTPDASLKVNESNLANKRHTDFAESGELAISAQEKGVKSHISHSFKEQRVISTQDENRRLVYQKTATRKNTKGSNKRPCSHKFGAAKQIQDAAAKVGSCSSAEPTNQAEGKNPGNVPDCMHVQDLIDLASVKSIESNGHPSCRYAAEIGKDGLPGALNAKVSGSLEVSLGAELDCEKKSNRLRRDPSVVLKLERGNCVKESVADSSYMMREAVAPEHDDCHGTSYGDANGPECKADSNNEQKNRSFCDTGTTTAYVSTSYEWPPSRVPRHFPRINSHYLPHATARLHLEVGHNFQQSSIPQMHQSCSSSIEAGRGRILPQQLPLSIDWPPMVGNLNGFASPLTCNYDSGFLPRRQCAMQQSFTAQSAPFNASASEDEKRYSSDFVDLTDLTSTQEPTDEYEGRWLSEEEYEMHTMACIDYNQYFGGGIMYWNPSDFPGAGFSRPPSMSSDDSSWAWREADMNRTVDDMVAFSSSYSTNGLASPSTAPFCSPFESLGPAQQAVGYPRPVNEVNSKIMHPSSSIVDAEAQEDVAVDVEAKSSDMFPYPMLRPIIIPNISRDRSRSEFKCSLDLRSPCVPPNRREKPRIKRPPSPVVLCVPHAPRPPPPSPVGDSRKQRGFPTVRSGSSSPRHWGVRGWFPDGTSFDEACMRMDGAEVIWPSWGTKKLPARQMVQPLTGTLLQERKIAISQLTHDQEHPDVSLPLQPPELLNCSKHNASLVVIQNLLHEEIDSFCKKVAAENLMRRPYINWAVKRVTRSLQVLWPRSRTNIFGSNATGLSLPTSDVDLVVCLPPVRNLEPIKEAGILEGRNGIKETCLQHAARYLANQEWVKPDSLKTVENTLIPIIMLVVEVPCDVNLAASNVQALRPTEVTGDEGIYQAETLSPDSFHPEYSEIIPNLKDAKSVRLDISFKSPSHTGRQTTELVQQLTGRFPAAIPLALVLKKFLADRCLDQAYSGGLSSYCLVLLIIRFLQHEHHLGRAINQNLGCLFMDFLYFFGNVFDPRQMRISIQGSGVYDNRERGYSIDPIYIDDPLFPTNNVGKNCFRIHQCIKAFADAYSNLENELSFLTNDDNTVIRPQYKLLQKLIPSISLS